MIDAKPRTASRTMLAAAVALTCLDVSLFTALSPLLPRYAAELRLSDTALGVLTASYALGAFIAAVPAGVVIERLAARRVVLTGVALIAVSSVTFGFADNFSVLVTARLTQGVASSLVWTGVLTVVSGAVPAARRGSAIGTVMSGAVAGALVGPVLGGIAVTAGTRLVFCALAAVVCVLGALATWHIGVTDRSGQGVRDLIRVVRHGTLARAGATVGVAATVASGQMLLGTLTLDKRGVSSSGIALVFLASSALQLIWNPLAGRIADRVGAVLPIRAGFAATALLLPLLPVVRGIPLVVLVFIAAGTAVNVVFVPATSWLAELAESSGLSRAFGFSAMGLFWAPGFMLGSLLVGALSEAAGRVATALVLASACGVCVAAVRAPA